MFSSFLVRSWRFGSGTTNRAETVREDYSSHFWYEKSCIWVFLNTQVIPFAPKLMFSSFLVRSWSFGSGTTNCAKTVREDCSSHFWYEKSCIWVFLNTQVIPFAPKLMFSAFLARSLSVGSNTTNCAKTIREDSSSHFWYEKSCIWIFLNTQVIPRVLGVLVLIWQSVRKLFVKTVLATFGTKRVVFDFFLTPKSSRLPQNSCLARF